MADISQTLVALYFRGLTIMYFDEKFTKDTMVPSISSSKGFWSGLVPEHRHSNDCEYKRNNWTNTCLSSMRWFNAYTCMRLNTKVILEVFIIYQAQEQNMHMWRGCLCEHYYVFSYILWRFIWWNRYLTDNTWRITSKQPTLGVWSVCDLRYELIYALSWRNFDVVYQLWFSR